MINNARQKSSSITTYLKSQVTEHCLLEVKLQEFLLRQHQNTQNTHKHSQKWSTSSLGVKRGVKKRRGQGVFIAEGLYQLLQKAADIRQPQRTFDTLHICPKAVLYVQVLPRGQLQTQHTSNVSLYAHVLFIEHAFGG